jgi:UDP-hydrolysing UDP-N-acetyl-D-glucosamine 2-epimerase
MHNWDAMPHFAKIKKKIAVFTGARAEYGLLRHLVQRINEDEELELQLIVSGSHLSERYGCTISEIQADGINPTALIPLSLDNNPQPSMAVLTAEALAGVGQSLESLQPQILIVLGDRYEAFAAASAAHLQGVPVCHLHGGESTFGAIDDRLRHAISQLSSLHFTAAEPYRERVIAMGHAPERVFNVGPMVLDGLHAMPVNSRSQFEDHTGFRFGEKNLLVTYHPETLLPDRGVAGFEALLAALAQASCNILFTHPNADEGSHQIMCRLKDFSISFPDRSWVVPSLGQKNYLMALQLFEAMAGNSSSGVIEAPFLGIPVLNIGDRQAGRLRHGYVLDVPAEFTAIASGLQEVLAYGQRSSWPRPCPRSGSPPTESIVAWLHSFAAL